MTSAEFERAFYEHKDAVYRFAWRMTGSPTIAEDITQDTFLALHRTRRFDPRRGSLRQFLLGVARNLTLKRWRESNRWQQMDGEAMPENAVATANGEVAEIVAEAVRSLPPLQREVVIFAEYDELSLDEIARTVGADVGTVKSRLHRARENLRHRLAALKPLNQLK